MSIRLGSRAMHFEIMRTLQNKSLPIYMTSGQISGTLSSVHFKTCLRLVFCVHNSNTYIP